MPAEETVPAAPAWDAEAESPARREEKKDSLADHGISDLSGPATFTTICLGFYIAFRLLGLLAAGSVARSAGGASDLLGIGVGLSGLAGLVSWALVVPLALCTIGGFLVWLLGVANNAEIIADRDLRISPGWQVAWYFAPLFNLLVPAIGMWEIIQSSRPKGLDSLYLLTALWWATWLLGTFGIAVTRIFVPPFGVPGALIDVSAAVLLSCSAGLLIVLIRTVTKAQRRFAEDACSAS